MSGGVGGVRRGKSRHPYPDNTGRDQSTGAADMLRACGSAVAVPENSKDAATEMLQGEIDALIAYLEKDTPNGRVAGAASAETHTARGYVDNPSHPRGDAEGRAILLEYSRRVHALESLRPKIKGLFPG